MHCGIKKLFSSIYIISLLFSFSVMTYGETHTTTSSVGQICLNDNEGRESCYSRSQVEAEFNSVRPDPEDPANVCLEPTPSDLRCYDYTDVQTALAPTTATPTEINRGGGQSGTVEPPPFQGIDPNSIFIGTFTGPDTAPLQGAYTAPLLQVADQQIAFQILVNFFLGIIGVVAVLYLVTNGYRYVMARGDEAQMTQAKKGIMFAIIGLLFVLGAYTIVATVLNFGARPPVTPGIGIGIGVSF